MTKRELLYELSNPAIADQDNILISINGETFDFCVEDKQRRGAVKTFPKELYLVPDMDG